jgi:hypothetical protein
MLNEAIPHFLALVRGAPVAAAVTLEEIAHLVRERGLDDPSLIIERIHPSRRARVF